MKQLNLSILEDGQTTGLTVRNGAFLAEAASTCLYLNNHSNSVEFEVKGEIIENYMLNRLELNTLTLNSYYDLDETVEYGAMGIAVAILNDQKSWKVKRSWKGTGFDYWVGKDDEMSTFQNKARLEVSGILEGNEKIITQRLNKKLIQTKKSDNTKLPAYAIIVEFSSPTSLTGKR